MKKIIPFLFLGVVAVFTQCKKDSVTDDGGGTTTTTDYSPVTAGSTFNYKDVSVNGTATTTTNYTLTIASSPTTLYSKQYYTFASSDTAKVKDKLKAKVGVNYYQLANLSLAGTPIVYEDNYLNDSLAVNEIWTQITPTISIPASGTTIQAYLTLKYKVAEKGVTKTVNAISYANVINVQLVSIQVTVPALGQTKTVTASGNYDYAKGIGMIQGNIDLPAQNVDFTVPIIGTTYTVPVPHYALTQTLLSSVVK